MVPGDSDLDSGLCRWIGLGDALRPVATVQESAFIHGSDLRWLGSGGW